MRTLIAPMHANKKGLTIGNLVPLGVAFVVIAFVISMGAEILQSLLRRYNSILYRFGQMMTRQPTATQRTPQEKV